MNKNISFKKFIKIFFYIFIVFILYHLIVWYFFTSKIFNLTDGYSVGDLGRMSYQVDLLHKRKNNFTLNKKHINTSNWTKQSIDIITLGDSFSNGGAAGLNPFYQDYLASTYNINVLNIHNKKGYSDLETINSLYNSGELKRLKPKAILIQSVVRGVIGKYSKNINKKPLILNINELITKSRVEIPIPKLLQINTANYKLPINTIKYKFNNNAIKAVYKLTLTKDLFSTKNPNKILLLKNSTSNLDQYSKENIAKLNDNFNILAIKLKQIGIKLFFMPTADKYDLYSDYIKDNPFKKNNFFDIIRLMKKDYYFIDTKSILLPLLDSGVQDVYYADDTHWSYKASEAISKSKVFNDSF